MGSILVTMPRQALPKSCHSKLYFMQSYQHVLINGPYLLNDQFLLSSLKRYIYIYGDAFIHFPVFWLIGLISYLLPLNGFLC